MGTTQLVSPQRANDREEKQFFPSRAGVPYPALVHTVSPDVALCSVHSCLLPTLLDLSYSYTTGFPGPQITEGISGNFSTLITTPHLYHNMLIIPIQPKSHVYNPVGFIPRGTSYNQNSVCHVFYSFSTPPHCPTLMVLIQD